MATDALKTISLQLQGREDSAPRWPGLFSPATRAAGVENGDRFLPAGYLQPRRSFDVGAGARAAAQDAVLRHQAPEDEVLVFELADGSTLVTSAQRLHDALSLSHPDLIAADDSLQLDRLREVAGQTRAGLGDLIIRVFSIGVGLRPDAILEDAGQALKDLARDLGLEQAQLGVSWAGAKALMWAIEKRLPRKPGLYAWHGEAELPLHPLLQLERRVQDKPAEQRILIFLHGTGSHTVGSFNHLREAGSEFWSALETQFPGGIYGFEHPTLSDSPIDNTLALLDVLPKGAHVSLVSHSRGGLVGDLLCLEDIPEELIAAYRRDERRLPGTGDAEPEAKRVLGELKRAHDAQQLQLRKLAQELKRKQLVVQRYVRVAAPAAGTRLASGNLDVFLSGVLSLIGFVPGLAGTPYYSAFKRVVIEIAKHRTNPRLVPGIEAMLPDAPLPQLLRTAPVRSGIEMAVIAGDIEGSGGGVTGLLQRLGVLLVDHLLFDAVDNDLVVDTPAMLAGIADAAKARLRLARGRQVSHFRYFENADTRDALSAWLQTDKPQEVPGFRALSEPEDYTELLKVAVSRSREAEARPRVIVLPGIMGTHLGLRRKEDAEIDRVWLAPWTLMTGGLAKIAWNQPEVGVDTLFAMFYAKLCEALSSSHQVEPFPYDWRLPLDVLADKLAERIETCLAGSGKQPVRLLAHSMGGLVVRACIHKHRALMDKLMEHQQARLVMLGTPNQGSYSMVENLIGKGDTVRKLALLDIKHDLQGLLNIIGGFRGALQLLPKPGFRDRFQGEAEGGEVWNFQNADVWRNSIAPDVRDFWFGDHRVANLTQEALDQSSWLWQQDGGQTPALPDAYAPKSIYVFGVAPNTPCGLRHVNGRLKLVGTSRGDGSVTWASGRIGGIDRFYYLPAAHGDLLARKDYFPAIAALLIHGETDKLPTTPPQERAIELDGPRSYDAGPPSLDSMEATQRAMLGASPHLVDEVPAQPTRQLHVVVRAMDLRYVNNPILVGHYNKDPLAGPESLVDSQLLDGALAERYRLDLYPGPLGTADALLKLEPNALGTPVLRAGAIITGLGDYDRPLTQARLIDAVRRGALEYLVQAKQLLPEGAALELTLATLLIGYNSSASLSIKDSVEALVRGVLQANERFESGRAQGGIRRMEIIELYIDSAITAAYALRDLENRLVSEAKERLSSPVELVVHELQQEGSARRRLYDASLSDGYWPRIIITDAALDVESRKQAPQSKPSTTEAHTDVSPVFPEWLRFAHVGQRARAEVVTKQRQPGAVEQLVRNQIREARTSWQPSFGRTLFQLMVPPEFKDTLRQLGQAMLVVDSFTANLPWELMLPEDFSQPGEHEPLALRTKLVRQFATVSFRRQVRASFGKSALVIGNPALDGFEQAFPAVAEPTSLLGAENEAQAVRATLLAQGYEVNALIGQDQTALSVLTALYDRPWRIIHVSAHGVFGLPHQDGRKRSGVLLSDGLLITAAEIAAMEIVPDLVFLNCCHLGTVESEQDGNKLAASIARELIDNGVRCVLVAGWAVDDNLASEFGKTFYTELIEGGESFASAVQRARRKLWSLNPDDITWGAFQAYGDPAWRVLAVRDPSRIEKSKFVSPDELLNALEDVRSEILRRAGKGDSRRSADEQRAREVKRIDQLCSKRVPEPWLERPDVQVALARTWRDLYEFGYAIAAYRKALQVADHRGAVGVNDVERLANLEAHEGERNRDLAAIQGAIQRLRRLNETLGEQTVERSALLGSAYKRKAGEYARRLIEHVGSLPGGAAANTPAWTPVAVQHEWDALRKALKNSIHHYRQAPDPYPTLNRLVLAAALTSAEPDTRTEQWTKSKLIKARRCKKRVEELFVADSSFWNSIMQAEALLAKYLLQGKLSEPGQAGDVARDSLVQEYKKALKRAPRAPREFDSMLQQLVLLERFYEALSLGGSDAAAQESQRRSAGRLKQLWQALSR